MAPRSKFHVRVVQDNIVLICPEKKYIYCFLTHKNSYLKADKLTFGANKGGRAGNDVIS